MINPILPVLPLLSFLFSPPPVPPDVHALHQRVLTLDTHADAPIMLQKEGFDVSQRHNTRKGWLAD